MANNIDSLFAALSDPTRRAVVDRLTGGPETVSQLHAPHDMALPTFLKHLKVLESSGLVTSEKAGRVRTVSLNTAPLRVLDGWIARHRQMWEGRLDRLEQLAQHLERTRS